MIPRELRKPDRAALYYDQAIDHDHVWGGGYCEHRIPVVDGVATLPNGAEVRSTSDVVVLPVPVPGLFVCGVCGATRNASRDALALQRRLKEYVG